MKLNDTLTELNNTMDHYLELIAKFSSEGKEKETEFFKKEYFRVKAVYDEELENWLAIF